MALSLGASLFSALGPDPYKRRQDEITRGLREAQLFAPVQQNGVRDLYGTRLGYDYKGGLGSVGQTFAYGITGWNSNYTQPVFGSMPTSPASSPNVTVNVSAIDAKGFLDHQDAIGGAAAAALNNGHQQFNRAVQKSVIG